MASTCPGVGSPVSLAKVGSGQGIGMGHCLGEGPPGNFQAWIVTREPPFPYPEDTLTLLLRQEALGGFLLLLSLPPTSCELLNLVNPIRLIAPSIKNLTMSSHQKKICS